MKISQIPRRLIFLAAALGFLLLMLVVSFFARGLILRKAIDAINSRVADHQYAALWDGARFRGLNTVFFKGIYFQSKTENNEIYLDSVSVRIKILPMILRKFRLHELACRTISVRYQYRTETLNTPPANPNDSTGGFLDELKNMNLSDMANRNIRRFFGYTPARVKINRIQVRISSADFPTVIGVHGLLLNRGEIRAGLVFAGDKLRVEIPVRGRFDKSLSVIELQMIKADTSRLPIPILQELYGIATGFDSLSMKINLGSRGRQQVNLKGEFSIDGFVLNGERLSTRSINIDHFSSVFLMHLGSHHVEIDSSSLALLNRISFRPYFSINLVPDPAIRFKLLPVDWKANDFFSSLPPGMFTSLLGMKASGELHYFLDFAVNLNNPDSLTFDTRLSSENLRIEQYGVDDYRMLNGSFFHQVYERGMVIASFEVGAGNPDFVPLEQISPFLRAAVMTSEDGSFFHHEGFNPRAFRESMATNIREKRFARGGSTITMQLVKNVFLTRNKTLARKIEEALIVWLIESNNLVSKQRMYEAYLNLIEWGPGIYGINQASRFYFNKSPADLSLAESVYLASIVPRPKWYRYTFDRQGSVRPFFDNYYRRLSELMIRRELISPGDTAGEPPAIMLKGPASRIFVQVDSTAADSVLIQELKIMPVL